MFVDDPKKVAQQILGGLKSEGPTPKTEDSEADTGPASEDGSEGLRMAAEDMMSAFASKDVDGLMASLDAYFTMRSNLTD